MKVICDNCGAMYKIPGEKLVKPVNKATCRQCGHRMLIPRPRRGADPDERTLVTAVPPTPAPPPMRAESGPTTTPIHEDAEEKTLPTGGRAVEETRWQRNDHSRPAPQPATASVATVSDPGERSAMTERVPAHGGPALPGPAATPQPHRQSPAPSSLRSDPRLGLDTPELELDASSVPAPSRKAAAPATPAAPAHDPRRDMGLALFGVIVALLGVTVLGITSVLDAAGPYYQVVLGASAVGLALALGGSVGAFLVLVTSGRGRKPAWRAVSVVLAVLVGLFLGAAPAAGRVGYDMLNDMTTDFAEYIAQASTEPPVVEEPVTVPEPVAVEPEPEPAPADAADAVDTDDALAEATEGQDAAPDPADDPPEARTSGAISPPRTTTTTRPPRVITSKPTGTTEPEPAPEDELELPDDLSLDKPTATAAVASNLPVRPPLQAIDIIVKSNTKVKKCFFDHQRAEGNLPPKVEVRFTIKPNGDATGISVRQTKLEGTELESCLIRSIRTIAFPPSQEGSTLTFPFVFG